MVCYLIIQLPYQNTTKRNIFRDIHYINFSSEEYYNIKNNKMNIHPTIGGGGQPSFWSKHNPLPSLNQNNILDAFEEFKQSDNCLVFLFIVLEREKNRQEVSERSYSEPVVREIEGAKCR